MGPPPVDNARDRWGVVVDDAEVTRIVDELVDPARPSVALVGEAGVGKTTRADAVVERLRSLGRTVEVLRGSHAVVQTPLGVMDDFDVGARRAATTIVVVDDAPLVDGHSAARLADLAREGHVRLLLTARDNQKLPPPFVAMLVEDRLRRRRVERLDDRDVERAVAAALGGPLAPHAARLVHDICQGVPLYARELIAEADLVHTSQGWEFDGFPPAPPTLLDLVAHRFTNLGPSEHDVLEIIAFAQPIAVSALAAVADADVLARLERAGLIVVDLDRRAGSVRLAHPVFDDVIRNESGVLGHRRAALRAAEALEASDQHGLIRLRAARLRLDHGLPLADDSAVAAARLALSLVHPALAEDLLRDAGESVDVAVTRAMAVGAQGRHDEADRLFSRIAVSDDASLSRVVAQRANNLRSAGRFGDAIDVLRAGLDAVCDRVVADELADALAYTQLWAGDRRSGGDRTSDQPRSYELLIGAVLAVMDGRLSETRRLVAAGTPEMAALEGDVPAARSLLALSGFLAEAFAGNADDAHRVVDRELARTLAEAEAAGTVEIAAAPGLWLAVRGMQALFNGDLDRARDDLAAATGRMRDADIAGMRALATAAAACAAAATGDSAASLHLADDVDASWRDETKVACLLQMANGWRSAADSDLHAAATSFARAARIALDGQHVIFAGLAVLDALRIDQIRPLGSLVADVCARWEGELAATISDHAAALTDDDPMALLTLARRYPAVGFRIAGAEVAMQAARRFTRRGSAADAAHAEYVAATTAAPLDRPCRLVLGTPKGLTDRERQIATLAADGASSRDVAEALDVSVRTVENHLASVYRKLGISGRRALAGWGSEGTTSPRDQSQGVDSPFW